MEYTLETPEEAEESAVPVTAVKYYLPPASVTGSTIGSPLTPAFRSSPSPKLHINIPTTILPYAFTTSGPAPSHEPGHLTLQPSLSSSQQRPWHASGYPASHTNSLSWTNPLVEDIHIEHVRWLEVERNLKRMELIPRSPFVPHTFQDWLNFRGDRSSDIVRADSRRLRLRQEYGRYPKSRIRHKPITTLMGGRKFNDGRGPVLSQLTVWSPWYTPTAGLPQAEWPSAEEMREEGDERNTSKFGRFLGLPRKPTNDTVPWKQKTYLEPTDFDTVWPHPCKEAYQEARKRLEVGVLQEMEAMLGRDLMNALDCVTDDMF